LDGEPGEVVVEEDEELLEVIGKHHSKFHKKKTVAMRNAEKNIAKINKQMKKNVAALS